MILSKVATSSFIILYAETQLLSAL